MKYFSFCFWLIPFSIASSRLICVVVNNNSFLFYFLNTFLLGYIHFAGGDS
jgi:prolipoprotein diacylglyceryltransferase